MSDAATTRPSLFPDGIERVQLYHRGDVLDRDIERCLTAGWEAKELDASGWLDRDRLHDDLAAAFDFPGYYGRNLDALDDALAGVVSGRHGFGPGAAGGLIVVRGLHHLTGPDPGLARSLVDILVVAAGRSLERGWPLAVLLQTDDRATSFDPVAAVPVGWNRAERGHR